LINVFTVTVDQFLRNKTYFLSRTGAYVYIV